MTQIINTAQRLMKILSTDSATLLKNDIAQDSGIINGASEVGAGDQSANQTQEAPQD